MQKAAAFGKMERSDEFRLHGATHSYLSDHSVNNSVVVPGSLFVSWALKQGGSLQNVDFLQMVPFSANSDVIFALVSSAVQEHYLLAPNSESACVKFTRGEMVVPTTACPDIPGAQVNGAAIYSRLDLLGNNYGSNFRGVKSVSIRDGKAKADWVAPAGLDQSARLVSLLDSFTHVLSVLSDQSSVYYLSSMAEVATVTADIPDTVVLYGELTKSEGNRFYANITATNASGEPLVWVKDICIAFDTAQANISLSVAGTFNLEPMTDYLEMWGGKLGLNVQPRMADYGQIIPTLIQENSVFDGQSHAQACFVRLQDWGQTAVQSDSAVTGSKNVSHQGLDTYELPDSRVVASLNQYETSYLYKEIFIDETYKRHNVLLSENDVVIDIGANIGLFSMFASQQADNISVIAVEPSPSVLPILHSNLSAFTQNFEIVAAGASDSRGEAEFTAYKKSSVFSGFMANVDDDRTAIKQVICNMLSVAGSLDEQELDNAAEEMLKDRMDSEQYICPLISVSDIIDEQGLETVSLLKIDAEKSEEAILKGIRETHWDIIEQIIIEVHKQSGIGVEGAIRLLEDKGFDCTEDEESFLTDSGLVTIYATKPARQEHNVSLSPVTRIEQSVQLFLDTLDRFGSRNNAQQLDVVICPSLVMDPSLASKISELEHRITEHLRASERIDVCSWDTWAHRYPVENMHDVVSDNAGHIPYTKEWYAGTATTLIRDNLHKIRKPRKVVVLDCDNTLWDGVVGEDGIADIRFQPHNLELQKFAKNLSDNGYVLCIASKNDEDIVRKVFAERSGDMVLSWDNIVASRINWTNKVENLHSLSEELNMNLDSFVFIDDSGSECAQMRAIHPQVLTIQFDETVGTLDYLENVWDLDIAPATEEDKNRTKMYAEETERRKHRDQIDDLEQFVESIDLKVDISPVDEATVPRASQMCMRTNQFNFASVRHTEAEIQTLITTDNYFVDKIRVADTFGDYGITGLLCCRREQENLVVETFLLSCRVLGRSVEHRVAAHLGHRALELGCNTVDFRFVRTERNTPAQIFIESIYAGDLEISDSELGITFDSNYLTQVKFKAADTSVVTATESSAPVASNTSFSVPVGVLHLIASEMRSATDLVRMLVSNAKRARPQLDVPFVAPENKVQEQMVSVWEELLGIEGIGTDDNFFKLGGTSLKGVEMISTLQRVHNIKINVAQIFEDATISHLAKVAMGEDENKLTLRSSKPPRVKSSRRKVGRRRSGVLAASRETVETSAAVVEDVR